MVKTTSSAGAPHFVDSFVGSRVQARRMSLGLTQSDLARALGISFQQVQKYEKGLNRLSASRLWETASLLGVQTDHFFEGLTEWSAADLAAKAAEPLETPTSHEISGLAPRMALNQQRVILDLLREMLARSGDQAPESRPAETLRGLRGRAAKSPVGRRR